MKTVRDIMTADVVTLAEHMTLREAIEALSAARVSGAPVVAGSAVVGVASRTDILEFEASSPGVPLRREGAVEFGEVFMGDATLDEDDDTAAYFVDRWADSGADVWSRISDTDSPEWDRLEEHSIAEVMSRKLVAVEPDATVVGVARVMVEKAVHRVLVMDDGNLLGVVSTMDVVRAVAESDGSLD
jgi:CBS domain-containing protein